jgi:hypothetical protein
VDLEERLVQLPQTSSFGWLHDYSDSVLPALHAIRRHGPGAARRGALLALVHLRGEAELDVQDLSVLRRLIRIKAARDVPYAFDACFNSWLTVRGGDQRGIMRVLGLTDSVPASYALGETLVCHLSQGGPDGQENFAHVFISPQLNGWTVVRGPSCDPDGCPQAASWAGRLSQEYGRAQAYFFGSQNDGDAWLVAEAGRIVRRYSNNQPETSLGDPLPIERRWLDHHGLSAPPEQLQDDEAFLEWALNCSAPAVAADLSIDPVWTGWPDEVQVQGHALIARTGAGAHQSVLRGCHVMRI